MPYTVKVVTNKDYEKIAKKYPEKMQSKIRDSWGFTDTKRKIAFVRSRRKKMDMLGTAAHEMMELLAKVSPHEEDGLRFKGKAKAPTIEYKQPPPPEMTPEESWLFNTISKPYYTQQLQDYQNIYQPLAQSLGGKLSADLNEPFTLPEEEWSKIWQKGREKALAEYKPIERRMTQRFAGTGALDSSGQVQKAFKDVELSKAKTIEDLAISQSLAEWEEKKAAKQLSYENILRFQGHQPTRFPINPTGSVEAQPYLTGGSPASLSGFEQFGSFVNPIYGDILRSQGYPAPGISTVDLAKIIAMQ